MKLGAIDSNPFQDFDKYFLDNESLGESMYDKNVDYQEYKNNKEEIRLGRTEWRA